MTRRFPAVCTVLAAIAGSTVQASPAFGQPGAPEPRSVSAPLRGPSNAALAYWRAWDVNRAADALFVKAGEDYKADAAWAPGPELTKLLEDHDGMIEQFVSIARIPDCDWGVDYDKGFMALIPHLGNLRRTVRVLACDGRRMQALGRNAVAAERVAAILRVGEHAKVDRLVISSLVSATITRTACDEIDAMMGAGRIGEKERAVLLAALREVSDGDAFNARSAWVNERDMMTRWIEERFTGDDAGKRFVDYLQGFAESTEAKESAARVALMNEAQLRAEVERLRRFYDGGLAAWDSADPSAGLAEVSRKAKAGEYGPLTEIIGASAEPYRRSYEQARSRLDATIGSLTR